MNWAVAIVAWAFAAYVIRDITRARPTLAHRLLAVHLSEANKRGKGWA